MPRSPWRWTSARLSRRRGEARASMDLSLRWAALSRDRRSCRAPAMHVRHRAGQRFSGVARGLGARALTEIGFDGYAVGGLAVGEGQATMFAVLDATVPLLPADRPRYLMGVGTPDDLIGAVARGIDMFDCVMPTRAGRTGRAFTSARHVQSAQCPVRRRSRGRSIRLRLPGLHAAPAWLSAPSVQGRGDAGADAADLAQSGVLPGPDARTAAAIVEGRFAATRRAACGWTPG